MTGRFARNLSLVLWLASLVGASLACANPRRGPGELPSPAVQAATQPATAALGLTDFPTAIPASPTAEAPSATPVAPTETPLAQPTVAPADTAAPEVTVTPEPDAQGDRVEGLLDQLDQANSTDEPQINDLSNVP